MSEKQAVREWTNHGLTSHLRRQASWLRDSYLWLLDTKILPDYLTKGKRPRALDVGCGPGYIMDIMAEQMDVVGLDLDPDMVAMCQARGLDVRQGDAHKLPFKDGEFDVVYCSYLLLFVPQPGQALEEMARVSRNLVVCLGEPDFGARIDYPEELARLTELVVKGLEASGGDPHIARKLRELFHRADLQSEMGIHPGVWELKRLWEEFVEEWRWAVRTAGKEANVEELEGLKKVWEKGLRDGTLFQYMPVFWCVGRK